MILGKWLKKYMWLSLALAAFVGFNPAWAAQARRRDKAASGFYLSVNGAYNIFGGDFDGKSFFDPGNEYDYVPKIESAPGFGLAFGVRWRKNAFEISFSHSGHDSTLDYDVPGSTYANMVNLVYKHFFSVTDVQPFINLEFGIPWWVVPDSGVSKSRPIEEGNVSYWGISLGGGGGLALQVTPRLAIHAGATARWMMVSDLYPAFEKRREIKGFSLLSPNFSAGLSYTF